MPDVPTDKGLEAALEVRFDSDAGDQLTVRDYLCELLVQLWNENDSFSGKAPWGNSGWEYELYKPLVKAGFIAGELDECGDLLVLGFDEKAAHAYVKKLIVIAFYGVQE
jgi:hypothetical protein